jgi:anti-sigma regulatory factor (Ser/Thr protein kinase)
MARRIATDALVDLGCSEETLDITRLLVSELVTNSLEHTESGSCLRVHVEGSELVVEVEDSNPSIPRLLHPEPDSLGGRGIELVDLLASRWGVDPVMDDRHQPVGKVVWFRLPR